VLVSCGGVDAGKLGLNVCECDGGFGGSWVGGGGLGGGGLHFFGGRFGVRWKR